jgi:hypothetical protein
MGDRPERIGQVREIISSGSVVWESVVWVSTSQLIFPSLYLQLKRAGLLADLPGDLVEYMDEFTSLNRERNRQIVLQSQRISELLNGVDIEPIFLKGTANVLSNLYEDLAERMIGDIDLLINENEIPKALEVLQNNNYYVPAKFEKKIVRNHRHYPVLVKDGEIAALEVHRWVVVNPYQKIFSFNLINNEKKRLAIPEIAYELSDSHKIIHNLMVVQMNDGGFWRGRIYLRQMYDLFLLSKIVDPVKTLTEFGHYFHQLNAYLAISTKLLDYPSSLSFVPTMQVKLSLQRFMMDVNHPKFARSYKLIINLFEQLLYYPGQLILAFFANDIRKSLYRKLRDRTWYGRHWRSLGGRLRA